MFEQFLITIVALILIVSPSFGMVGNPMIPAPDPKCTVHYNKTGVGPKFIIKTPYFPATYDSDTTCGWMIESQENTALINVTFHYFNLESKKICKDYDYVMVFSRLFGQSDWTLVPNNMNMGQDEMGGFCGKTKPFWIAKNAKSVYIKFHSDGQQEAVGFNATFDIVITPGPPEITRLGQGVGMQVGENQTVVNGEQREMVTMSCVASGSPPPSYKWYRNIDGDLKDLKNDPLVKASYPNGTIQFHNIQMSDEGEFTCIAKNKLGEDMKNLTMKVKEKCLCQPKYRIAWFPKPPYTPYESDGITKGVFFALLNHMFFEICGNCTLGHGQTVLEWTDQPSKERGVSDLKEDIENGIADIYLPIEGLQTDKSYRSTRVFVPLVGSPGVALVVIGAEEGKAAMLLFDTILTLWPIFVLIVIMAILAGIIVWMLDTYYNEEEFPRNFLDGVIEGTWWAFITMTTVGYGDIAPRGIPGRLFGVLWILTGLVITAIFTSGISTALTVQALSTDVKLYGTDLAALNDSTEYRMGVIKNAKMKNLFSYQEIKSSMDNREVEGSLLDAYVANYYKALFKTFRVNNVFTSTKAYGIVLGKELEKFKIPDFMEEYKEKSEAEILKIIGENVPEQEDPAKEASSSEELFAPSNKLFINSLIGCFAMLIVFSALGLLYEFAYLRPAAREIEAAKNLEMVDSQRVKTLDDQLQTMKKKLRGEVHDFHARWGERLSCLNRKHEAEQNEFKERGKQPLHPNTHHPKDQEMMYMSRDDVKADMGNENHGYHYSQPEYAAHGNQSPIPSASSDNQSLSSSVTLDTRKLISQSPILSASPGNETPTLPGTPDNQSEILPATPPPPSTPGNQSPSPPSPPGNQTPPPPSTPVIQSPSPPSTPGDQSPTAPAASGNQTPTPPSTPDNKSPIPSAAEETGQEHLNENTQNLAMGETSA